MKRGVSIAIVVAGISGFGCGRKAEDGAAPTAPTAPAVIAPAPAPAPAPTAPSGSASGSVGVAELPEVAEIPPLDLTLPDRKKVTASSKLNGEGLKLVRAGDHAKAIEKYKEALVADPGNLLARYNLACAWNLSGDAPRGLAVLKQLQANGCRACLAALIGSRTDKDWDSLRQDPRYLALTAAVTVEPADLAKISEQLAEFDGKLEGLEPYVHPRSPVKVVVDGEAEWTLIGHADLVKWEQGANKKSDPELRGSPTIKCKPRCCEFSGREEPPGDRTLYLDKICFDERGGVPFLSSIEFNDFRQSPP